MSEPAPKPPGHPVIAVVLASLAILGLGYAAVSRTWLYNSRTIGTAQEVGMGPRGTFMCNLRDRDQPDDEVRCDEDFVKAGATCVNGCLEMSNGTLVSTYRKMLGDAQRAAKENPGDTETAVVAEKLEDYLKTSGAWTTFGYVALGACALTIFSLFTCIILVIARRRIAWRVMPTTTAMLAIIPGLIAGPVFLGLKPGPTGFVGIGVGFDAYGIGIVVGMVATFMFNKVLRPYDRELEAV